MKYFRTISLTLALGAALAAANSAANPRILILVGPSSHPPGTHEVAAGGRLMQWALENMENVRGVKADLLDQWPQDKKALDGVRTVVFIGDTFPPQRLPERDAILKELGEMMSRGAGLVCVHYATGLRAQDVQPDGSHPLLGWLGGYFATRTPHHQSVAKVFNAVTVAPAAPEHPVSRGWREFTVDEEPYYNNYFGPGGNQPAAGVAALATAMLPPEAPKKEIVAWGVERKDGGRGFGIVMPHFYKNWANEDLRRLIMNGIVWTAKLDVPRSGVKTPVPDLARFMPGSVEPRPSPPAAK
jgi:type 1 glutamine amidotransferase